MTYEETIRKNMRSMLKTQHPKDHSIWLIKWDPDKVYGWYPAPYVPWYRRLWRWLTRQPKYTRAEWKRHGL